MSELKQLHELEPDPPSWQFGVRPVPVVVISSWSLEDGAAGESVGVASPTKSSEISDKDKELWSFSEMGK